MTALRWREMTDEQREQAYSPSSSLANGDYRPFIEAYRQRSRAAWSELQELYAAAHTIPYGTETSQTIDIAVPNTDQLPPLLVFLHGGYWQELSKTDSRFAAAESIKQGWAFAAVDYTLAPSADLPTIVEECRQAIRFLHDQADDLGYDPTRIFVAGSSAGAHLAAMVCLAQADLAVPVRGAILVSGIYELEPLIDTSINDALDLDRATASANSPIRADLHVFPQTVIAYGAIETTEFKAQSMVFAERLSAVGAGSGDGEPITALEVPDRNHFDVILDLATPQTALGDAVAELIDAV